MAYNYNFPMYNQYGQNIPQQMPQQMPQQIPQYQQESGGFVTVRSEAEARNYPVGYGKSVTFKDETAPYIYSKTMGYSQLDVPVFEKYKLVKEEAQEEPKPSEADNLAFEKIKAEIGQIWKEIEAIKKEVQDESSV